MTKTSYHRFEYDTSREVDYDAYLADQLKFRDKKKNVRNFERIRTLRIIKKFSLIAFFFSFDLILE